MPPRRTHTKSRNGCTNCKRHRVKAKCDESVPACFNCKRREWPCSLSGELHVAQPDAQSLPTPASVGGILDATHPPVNLSTIAPALSHQIAPFSHHELASKSFELMHHYCTVTAATLSLKEEMHHVWRVSIPREGYRHGFVMHGILAIAAAHKAYLMPDDRQTYMSLSDYYQTIGSEAFRSALTDTSSEMGPAIFSFASVVTLYMFALPTRDPGNFLDAIHDIIDVARLLRGIQVTLSSKMPVVLRQDFAALVYSTFPLDSSVVQTVLPDLEGSILPLDTWEAIDKLGAFLVADIPASSLVHYVAVVDDLRRCAKLVAASGVNVEAGTVLMFMYNIHETILVDIVARRPHALIILAHYSIMLAPLEKTFWYARGWSSQLMQTIERELYGQEVFLSMLRWPKENLQSYSLT